MQVKTFSVVMAFLILVFVIELVRRQKMTFKFSLAWLLAGVGALLLTCYDDALRFLAGAAGFQLLSNFIYFLLLIFFVLLSLFLTLYINEQNNRAESLAQSLGILEYQLHKLESKMNK